MRILLIVIISLITLSGCKSNNFEMHQMQNGNQAIVDVKSRRIVIINQSNRIVDVVNIDLNNNEVEAIKSLKEANDKKLKVIKWDSIVPPKEKYTIKFSTRFYNDKCLFTVSISPWDKTLGERYGFYLTTIELIDSSGFSLEEIDLSTLSWTRNIDEEGNPKSLDLSGKLQMTLESYMEIKNWTPTWRSPSQ